MLYAYRLHLFLGIPRSRGDAEGESLGERRDLFPGESDVESGGVRFEVAAALRAGDRYDVLPLRMHPCQCDLSGCTFVLRCDFLYRGEQLGVAPDIVRAEARVVAPPVFRQQHIEALDRGGQKAAAQWRIRHETDAEFATGWQHDRLDVPAPKRIFGLDGDDRVNVLRPSNGLGSGLGQGKITHLSRLDQARHRADGLFDRHRRIDTVEAVDIDHIDTEAFERSVACLRHIIGMAAAQTRYRDAGEPEIAELGRDQRVCAPALQRPSDELFVHPVAVSIGGHKEIDAELQRPVDRRYRLLVIGLAVADRHAHATQALC